MVRKISRSKIVNRFKAGEKVTAIATALDTSRQYVSWVIKNFATVDDPDNYRLTPLKDKTKPLTKRDKILVSFNQMNDDKTIEERVDLISKEFKTSNGYVRQVLANLCFADYGVTQNEIILNKARAGATAEEIIAETKFKESKVKGLLRKEGLYDPFVNSQKRVVLRLAAEGKTQAQIAFETGIPLGYVISICIGAKTRGSTKRKYYHVKEYEALVKAAEAKSKEEK